MKKFKILLLALLFLIIPSIYAAPQLENGSFTYTDSSTWATGQVVYNEVNNTNVADGHILRVYNFSKTSLCVAVACGIFNNSQTDHRLKPAAYGLVVGNDCILSESFDELPGQKYKWFWNFTGVGQQAKQDPVVVYPKVLNTLINMTGAGYGDTGTWTTQNTQSRCFGSAWVEDITLPGTAADNITLTANSLYNSSSILNFSVVFTTGTANTTFTTLNGTLPIFNLTSAGNYNITFVSNEAGGYHNITYFNINISSQDFVGNLSKLFFVANLSYARAFFINGKNYTRNLSYTINYTCPSFADVSIDVYINNSLNSTASANCTNRTVIYTGYYPHTIEGPYNISFNLNNSYYSALNNLSFGYRLFISDLLPPNITYLNISNARGFSNTKANISMNCTDTIMSNLTYNMTFNEATKFYNNLSNGYLKILEANTTYGNNTLIGVCFDPFSNDTNTLTNYIYGNLIILIDEIDNTLFNPLNANTTKVYFDDNSTYYDFRASSSSSINFTSYSNDKLRFELTYDDGTVITRYIDISTLTSQELRVCANKEGITHYEQLIISATQRKAVLKNVFSNCLVASDYTRFAYQDAFLLKAFTIASLYYLYADIDGSQVILASLDGSTSTFINLDTLEFKKQGYNINIGGDGLSISKLTNTSFLIKYININQDNVALTATISNTGTGAEYFTTSDFTNFNNFTMVFDYSTLSSITNATIFQIQLTKTSDKGIITTFKRYFSAATGRPGILENGFAFIISLIILITGLTFVASRYTFAWFGIFMLIMALAPLTFAVGAWYITLLMAMEIIILVFIVLVMVIQNPQAQAN